MIVNFRPFIATISEPSTLSYAKSGIPAPIIAPATVEPIVLKVESDWRSPGSAVIADAIEPYGIFTEV